jgi:hypothetical protein
VLCGKELVKVVRSVYAIWLWPKVRIQRQDHDREAHPESMGTQARAEKIQFGPEMKSTYLSLISISRFRKTSLRTKERAVDEIMKMPVGRRLMRGFSILKGNR